MIYYVGMHIVENKSASKTDKKIYRSILLRQSYRDSGKVKKRTIANLSNCTPLPVGRQVERLLLSNLL